MFDLEQSITDWRKQMLAAGIKTPVPLEELEIHLREEVERQLATGLAVEQAFKISIRNIGHAQTLKTEFARAKGSQSWRGNGLIWANRILAALWMVGCLWSLNTVVFGPLLLTGNLRVPAASSLLWISLLAVLIYATGIIGSILLFCGSKWGRSIIRIIALLFVIACIAQLCQTKLNAVWRAWCGIWAIFSLTTIWLLHSPRNPKIHSDIASA